MARRLSRGGRWGPGVAGRQRWAARSRATVRRSEAVATTRRAATRRARGDRAHASDTAAMAGFDARASSHGQDGRPTNRPSARARSTRPTTRTTAGVASMPARRAWPWLPDTGVARVELQVHGLVAVLPACRVSRREGGTTVDRSDNRHPTWHQGRPGLVFTGSGRLHGLSHTLGRALTWADSSVYSARSLDE